MSGARGGRYFGPARFFLVGDKVLAQRHTSEARMLLGYMRDQMLSGGPTYQAQYTELQDGTRIKAVMNNGLFQAEIISGRVLVPIKQFTTVWFLLQPVIDAATTRPYMVKIPERHVIYDAGADELYAVEELPFGEHNYWWSGQDTCTVYDGTVVSFPGSSFYTVNNRKYSQTYVRAAAMYNSAVVRCIYGTGSVSVVGAYSGSYGTAFLAPPQFSPDGSQLIGYLNAGGGSGMIYTYVIGTKNPTTSGMTWTRYDIPHEYVLTYQSNPQTITCSAEWVNLPPDGQVGGQQVCEYVRPYAEDVWIYEQLEGVGFLNTGAPAVVTVRFDERTINDPFLMVTSQTYTPTAYASWVEAVFGGYLQYEGYRTYHMEFGSDQFHQDRLTRSYQFFVNGELIREFASERTITHTVVSSGERSVFNGGAPIVNYDHPGPSTPQPPMPEIPDWSTTTQTDSEAGTHTSVDLLWFDTREHVYLFVDTTTAYTSLLVNTKTGTSQGTVTDETVITGGTVLTTSVRVVTRFGEVLLMSREHTIYEPSGPAYPTHCAAREGVAVIALIGAEYGRTWVVRYSGEAGVSASEITGRIPEGWEISDVTLVTNNELVKKIVSA